MVKSRIYGGARTTLAASLPEDIIIFEILCRLPARSLLRFRCASKSWCWTISSTDFAESHLQMSVRSPNTININSRLLISSPPFVKSINYHELSPPFITTVHNHPLGNTTDPNRFFLPIILGSCKGLVCLLDGDCKSVILYNPSTRRYRSIRLPDPLQLQAGTSSLLGTNLAWWFIGFGFDSDLHEYKVVRYIRHILPRTRDHHDINTMPEVEVLSFTDINYAHEQPTTPVVIRTLPCDYDVPYDGRTVFFNGSLYLIVDRQRNTSIGVHRRRLYIILRLDFAREVFDEVPGPGDDVCQTRNYRFGTLELVEGCLSLVSSPSYSTPEESIHLWVMKEYGVKQPWTKLLSIPSTFYENFIPLKFINDREILLVVHDKNDRQLVIFNSEEGSFDKVFTYPDLGGFEDTVYVESLISP